MCNVLERSCFNCRHSFEDYEPGDYGSVLSTWIECKFMSDKSPNGEKWDYWWQFDEWEYPTSKQIYEQFMNAEIEEDFIRIGMRCNLYEKAAYDRREMRNRMEQYAKKRARKFTHVCIRNKEGFKVDHIKEDSFYKAYFRRCRNVEDSFFDFNMDLHIHGRD